MQVTAKFDRRMVWRRGGSMRYLVVRVTGTGEAPQLGRAALNLALVVDASGSMEGEPLNFAIDAAQRVVRRLSDEDRLSVVSFDNRALDHLVSETMTPEGRERAVRALGTIHAGGPTNLSGGWLRGAEHVASAMEAELGTQNRVILLSDGHANSGIVDPAELAEHASQLALRGLISSTVGIGDNYHAETLEAIAMNGGGTHHRAARPHEIVEVVSAELEDLRLMAAESVKVTLRHAPGVQIKCLNEFPLTSTAEGAVCSLGSLTAGASRTAVFRVKFPSGKAGEEFPFEVRASWKRPGGEVSEAEPLRVAACFAEGSVNRAQEHDAELTEVVAQVWQAYLVRRVVRLNRERQYTEAVQLLDRHLPSFTRYAKNAKSGPALLAELEKVRRAASREWKEGNRKEVEITMLQCAYSREDSRAMAKERKWDELLS